MTAMIEHAAFLMEVLLQMIYAPARLFHMAIAGPIRA